MRAISLIILYTALIAGANSTLAENTNISALNELRQGDMQKLVLHAAPKRVSDISFLTKSGAQKSLDDYKGRYVLVNFWATWCEPSIWPLGCPENSLLSQVSPAKPCLDFWPQCRPVRNRNRR